MWTWWKRLRKQSEFAWFPTTISIYLEKHMTVGRKWRYLYVLFLHTFPLEAFRGDIEVAELHLATVSSIWNIISWILGRKYIHVWIAGFNIIFPLAAHIRGDFTLWSNFDLFWVFALFSLRAHYGNICIDICYIHTYSVSIHNIYTNIYIYIYFFFIVHIVYI